MSECERMVSCSSQEKIKQPMLFYSKFSKFPYLIIWLFYLLNYVVNISNYYSGERLLNHELERMCLRPMLGHYLKIYLEGLRWKK